MGGAVGAGQRVGGTRGGPPGVCFPGPWGPCAPAAVSRRGACEMTGKVGVWPPRKLSPALVPRVLSVSSPSQAEPTHGPRPPVGHSASTGAPRGPEQVNQPLAGGASRRPLWSWQGSAGWAAEFRFTALAVLVPGGRGVGRGAEGGVQNSCTRAPS